MNVSRKSFPVFLLCLSLAYAQGQADPYDIAGFWSVRHPKPEWGSVLLHFEPRDESISFQTKSYPSFKVSLWKETKKGLRKLRDGIFSSFTQASLLSLEGCPSLLWHSPEDRAFRFNEIRFDDGGKKLLIRPEDPSGHEPARELSRVDRGPAPILGDSWPLVLEGVYEYWHPATGKVFVAFRKKQSSPSSAGAAPSFSVLQVREVAGLGWAIVKEGLYGGSHPHDECLEFFIQALDGELWMLWSNPARRGVLRRNRIVTRYDDGDLGLSPAGWDGRYLEDGRFDKVCGSDVRVAAAKDFLDLEGLYEIRPSESLAVRMVRFLPDGGSPEASSLFRVETLAPNNAAPGNPFFHNEGLFPGDLLSLVNLDSQDGRCLLRFHDPSGVMSEECFAGRITTSGDFSLFGAGRDEAQPLFSFYKRPSSAGDADQP